VPLFIRHGDCGRDGIDAFERRGEIFRRRADGIACELEESVRVGETCFQIAHALQRAFSEATCLRTRSPRQQILLEELVEQPAVLELLRRHGIAGDDHVERRSAPMSRGRRCVPPRRESAPVSLPARRSGALHGDAVMTTQGQFQPAAHAGAGDGRDDGFPAFSSMRITVLRLVPRKPWASRTPGYPPAGERARAADQHHGLHVGIGFGTGQPSTMSCRRSNPTR